MVGPVPTAVGRWLFAPELRDAADGLQDNDVALRLAALWTPVTGLFYLCGVVVGIALWMAYQWWPPRERVAALSLGLVGLLVLIGLWAGRPRPSLSNGSGSSSTASPQDRVHFPCGSWLLQQPDGAGNRQPAETLAISGFSCKTVTTYQGYRQVASQNVPATLSPVRAETPEGAEISGKFVAAQYDDVIVIAGSDRLSSEADQVFGLGVRDGSPRWHFQCGSPRPHTLTIRFARVPAGDDPARGHLTLAETKPQVIVGCDEQTVVHQPDHRGAAMSRATKYVTAAKFVGGVYLSRVQVAYWAKVRGDLFSRLVYPADRTDPYEIYELMRARGPLLPTRLGNYSTTSHRLSSEVLRSRNYGVSPADGGRTRPSGHAGPVTADPQPAGPHPDPAARRTRLHPPPDDRLLALVDQAIHRLLDQCEQDREFDLMAGFASPLPIAVMTRLLGLPDDPTRFRRLGSTIAQALDGIWSLRQAKVLPRPSPNCGTPSPTCSAGAPTIPGTIWFPRWSISRARAHRDELAALVRLLLIAGFETTVNAIGNGMRWLLADREQWEQLVADPGRAEAVAEEVLRFDPPVQQTVRVAHADVELGGVTIAKNQWVITLLAAANRDPEVFEEPNRFDVARQSAAEHLAFSGGIHYCLGSPLARMELAQAFRGLAERFPAIRMTEPLTMRPGTTLRGPLRFPVATA